MKSIQDKFFLDTNVLVYTFDRVAEAKCTTARDLLWRALETHRGVISYQVVQEFLNVATRKFAERMIVPEALLFMARILMPLCEVFPNSTLYSQALSIADETGLSFYDSLIVSAAIAAECKLLWTEDLQHGRRIRDVEIRNPFVG